VLTSRLCLVHSLPSAIRLEEYIVPDAFRSCAERRSREALTDPNPILSAIEATQTRIGLVLSITLVINGLPLVPNHSTFDACSFSPACGTGLGQPARKLDRTCPLNYYPFLSSQAADGTGAGSNLGRLARGSAPLWLGFPTVPLQSLPRLRREEWIVGQNRRGARRKD
jgi:hypothetical protein